MLDKCETYSDKCANWDGATYEILPVGKYPKSRRIASRLKRFYFPSGNFLLMCQACHFAYSRKHPELTIQR